MRHNWKTDKGLYTVYEVRRSKIEEYPVLMTGIELRDFLKAKRSRYLLSISIKTKLSYRLRGERITPMEKTCKAEYAWFAEAQCRDGMNICVRFEVNENQSKEDQQCEIECWLLDRTSKHGGAFWYSVGMFEL